MCRLNPLHRNVHIQQYYKELLENPENDNDVYLAIGSSTLTAPGWAWHSCTSPCRHCPSYHYSTPRTETWAMCNPQWTFPPWSTTSSPWRKTRAHGTTMDRVHCDKRPWLHASRRLRQVTVHFDRLLASENRSVPLPVTQTDEGAMASSSCYLNSDDFWQTLPDTTAYT